MQAGEFIDDLGRTFNFQRTDQFATRAATGALSLYRMGKYESLIRLLEITLLSCERP